jgi:2-polyprenyl-3-methyl-5-hydroxy-6-metoxy-1,4-benzoquinol methylase
MAKHSSNPLRLPKPASYYANAREDVLEIARRERLTGKKVVEVGCARGVSGQKLKALVGAELYVGVELDVAAAEQARTVLDQAHVANIEKTSPSDIGIELGQFDLLVAIDVLEHLYDPWETLAAWAAVLKPGGKLLLSIPNVQNIKVIARLIAGLWEYEEEGLLDATHLRFFTLKSLISLLSGAGLELTQLHSVLDPVLDMSRAKDKGNAIHIEEVSLGGLTRQQMNALTTYQYIAIAQKLTDSAR